MHLPKIHQIDDFIVHDLEGSSEPYHFLKSIIVPRPIAFITTRGENGVVNAAPFSYFNAVCIHPTIISVSMDRRNGLRKDTSRNIFSTKEFVINICSIDLAKAISLASIEYPPEVSEIDLANLSLIPSHQVSVPRIANSPIQLECKFNKSIEIEENRADLILGNVVKVHLHKNILDSQGRVDFVKLNPIARLSGNTYAKVTDFFSVN